MILKYTQFVIRNRWVVLLLSILVMLAMSGGMMKLGFTNDYQAFFSDENPQLKEFEQVQKTYSRSDNVFVMMVPSSGAVFEPETLNAILEFTDKAWKLPFVRRVDSLSNYQYSYGLDDDLIIEDLYSEPLEVDLGELKRKALGEPLLLNRIISPGADATAINISLNLPGDNPLAETPEIVGAVRELVQSMKSSYPQIEFYETGVVMLDNAMAEATVKDLSTLVPLTYVLVAIGVGFFLRSFYLTLATVGLVILSISAAMGMAGWMGIVLTPPSASVPPIIMTLAVADCLHLLVTLQQKQREGESWYQAIGSTTDINFSPIFLTSVTTAIGFLSLNFSDAPPFRDLGNMTAIGVLCAFFLSLTFLPSLLAVLPHKEPRHEAVLVPIMEKLAKFVIRARKGLLVAGFALIVGLCFLIPKNELNDNFVEYFDDSIKFRTDTDEVTRRLSGMYFVEYSLNSGEAEGISEPQFLKQVEMFEDWLKTQPEVVHVDSIVEIVRRLHYNLHGDQERYYQLPDQREQIAQYLLLYEMSLPNGLDLNSQINVDKSATRVTVSLKTMSTTDMLAFEDKVNRWMRDTTPDLVSTGVSPSMMFSHISVRNISSMLLGTAVALVFISALLIFPLRSVKHGLLSLVSNLAPALMAFGIWALLVGKVSLGVSVVIAMTLGIVVDDTIHLISKYLRARRTQGLDSRAAIQYAFSTVGIALFGTTFILVCGFLVMATSGFQVNSHMGVLSAITICLALIIDLLLIPPLLLLIDGSFNTDDSSPTST